MNPEGKKVRDSYMSLTFVEGYMGNYDWEVSITEADNSVAYAREGSTEDVLDVINNLVESFDVANIGIDVMNVDEDNADTIWEGPHYALGRARVVIETLNTLWAVQRLR